MEVKNLTLRDYFAAQALVGLLANSSYFITGMEEEAYRISDEMIKYRTVQTKQEGGGDSDE